MKTLSLFGAFAAALIASASAETLAPAVQAKIDAKIQEAVAWAADPVLVSAARAQNASLPADFAGLNQDKWRTLSVLDPLVRGLTKNPVGQFLKGKKDDVVTEAFASDASGGKLGFIAKTTNWSHKGKEKHEVPMTGKPWQGPVELDESSGQQQLQIAVPILDQGKPVGSLVVGLSVTKLSH